MRAVFVLLLVLPALVFCCDTTTQYERDGQCCKMCGPGTRMKQNTDCNDPICQDCESGEYQDGYTKEAKCKRQPFCDPNLNFKGQTNPSKTKLVPCECIPNHHCSNIQCMTCIKNTVCEPGQQITEMATQKADTVCESCPEGTFSSEQNSKCQPWKECPFGHIESTAGTQISDRSCEPYSNLRLGIGISIGVVVIAVIGVLAYKCYKKGKTGSACIEQKLQQHCPTLFPKPAEDITTVENELLQPTNLEPINHEHHNEPQENEDEVFKHGLTANGMPVDQDHSKMSLSSQLLTSEESFSTIC